MRNQLLLIILYTALITTMCFQESYGQSAESIDVFEIGQNFVRKNQYKQAVDSLLIIKNQLEKKPQKSSNTGELENCKHALALFGSFIGEDYHVGQKSKSRADLLATKFSPAIPYIIKQAKERRIVMINEDHNLPKHRLLTYNLLDDFYKMGFRYLALESLIPNYESTIDLTYPVPYMLEPNMANLVKKAKRLGFKLIAYESQDTTEENSKRPYLTDNLRELNQANNLRRIFTKDPGAKILVHAGHGHVWEQGNRNVMMMAEYFKAIAGIDPLTINQSVGDMSEFTDQLERSNDFHNSNIPYVVLNDKGIAQISQSDNPGDYDLLVTWPNPRIRNGRNGQLLNGNEGIPYMISVSDADAGKLIQIVEGKTFSNQIPVDQFVVKKGFAKIETSLRRGNYWVRVFARNGKIESVRKITIN